MERKLSSFAWVEKMNFQLFFFAFIEVKWSLFEAEIMFTFYSKLILNYWINLSFLEEKESHNCLHTEKYRPPFLKLHQSRNVQREIKVTLPRKKKP